VSTLTYLNVIEHLITSSFGGPQDAEQKDIQSAVQRAYTELAYIRDWSYYHTHGRIITKAVETGEVSSYSGTTLTLSSGLTGSGFTHVRVDNVAAEIASTTSASVYELDSQVKFPAGSVVSGEIASFYKMNYTLPADFRNLDEPSDEYNWWSGAYVTPDEAMKMERVNFQTGSPLHWTVIKDPNSRNWVLKLVGYPTSVETVDFTYRRSPSSISSNSDVVDMPPHMHNAMLSCAEYWLARIRSTNVQEKYNFYQRDLRLAMEADQLAPISGRSRRVWHDGGWRSPLLADNFDYGF